MSQWSNNNPSRNNVQLALSYWNLLISLVSRDIRARYRRTILGPLWAVLPAILSTAIFTFLGGLIDVQTEGAPRVVFVFAGTLPWTFFQSSVVRIPHGVLANGTLLRKMPVPRQIFPLVVLLTNFFDLFMGAIVLFVVLLLYGIPITWAWLWLPVLIFISCFLGWAVGIGISAFSIYRRDMLHGIQYIMQIWLFLTPVFYSVSELQERMYIVYRLNPAVGIIDGFRRVIIFGQAPDLSLLLTCLVMACAVLIISLPLYRFMSRYFTDVV